MYRYPNGGRPSPFPHIACSCMDSLILPLRVRETPEMPSTERAF